MFWANRLLYWVWSSQSGWTTNTDHSFLIHACLFCHFLMTESDRITYFAPIPVGSFGSIHNEKCSMDSCYWTLFSCKKHTIIHLKFSIYFIAAIIFPRFGRTQNRVTATNQRQPTYCIVHLYRSDETSPAPPPIAINWMLLSEQPSHNLTTIILPQIRIIVWGTRGRLDIISCKYFDIKHKTEE